MAVSLMHLDVPAQPLHVRASYGTRIQPSWTFDTSAIRHACELLGVSAPVVICCAEYRRGRWSGMHSFEHGAHRVRIARWASANRASEILWHELTHCAQRDRGEDMSQAFSLTARSRLSREQYDADPRENEAHCNEVHAEFYPLVRERR